MQEYIYQGVAEKNRGLVSDEDKKEQPKLVKDIELMSSPEANVNVM